MKYYKEVIDILKDVKESIIIGIGFIIICLGIFIHVYNSNNSIKNKIETTATLIDSFYVEDKGYQGIYEVEDGFSYNSNETQITGRNLHHNESDIEEVISIYYDTKTGEYQEELNITSYTPYFIGGLLLTVGAIVSQKKNWTKNH